MGTRAFYFFEDDDGIYGVYKHYDGYPQGAASHIEAAKDWAWKFPRFEADEFASAFVAANKNKDGGEIRLLPMFDSKSIDMVMKDYTWCDYYYHISYDSADGGLVVRVFESVWEEAIQDNVWKLTSYMTHKQMLRAYAEAS
jgi:hypothetical protein